MGERTVVDRHDFTLLRYQNDSVDIICNRSDFDVEPKTAYLEACVVARSLGEEIYGQDEIFSLRTFSDGTVSTQWRGTTGFATTWPQFKWIKKRLTQGVHSGVIGLPKNPGWILWILWGLEFCFCKMTAAFVKSPPPLEEIVLEPPAPDPQDYPENVIQFRKR